MIVLFLFEILDIGHSKIWLRYRTFKISTHSQLLKRITYKNSFYIKIKFAFISHLWHNE